MARMSAHPSRSDTALATATKSQKAFIGREQQRERMWSLGSSRRADGSSRQPAIFAAHRERGGLPTRLQRHCCAPAHLPTCRRVRLARAPISARSHRRHHSAPQRQPRRVEQLGPLPEGYRTKAISAPIRLPRSMARHRHRIESHDLRSEALAQRLLEDREAEIDLVVGDRDRRRDAEDAPAAAHDARRHAEFQAAGHDARRRARDRASCSADP